MADDFEKAVLLQFDQSPTTPAALKTQAATYIESLKTTPDSWRVFIQRFSGSTYLEVKFWCLQAILETLPRRHSTLSPDEKSELRGVILNWILDAGIHSQPVLLRNKLAQVVAQLVRLEYPKSWPSFFNDLIHALQRGLGVADLFCRIFLAIDSDIISQDIHRSVQDQKTSVQLKDAMRETCIKEVVEAWFNLVVLNYTTEPDFTALVLSTLQKYISWMSIGLVVNNKFMPLLFELLKSPNEELQEASIDCLTEILLKGMEPSEKIYFIQKMGVVGCCASWKEGLPGTEGDELREKCAKLLSTLCSEILECCKRIENSCISLRACKLDIKSSVKAEANQICSTCESMMQELFPVILSILTTTEDSVLMTVVPYLNTLVLRLKHFQERVKILPEKDLLVLRRILQGVLLAARYPNPSSIPPSGEFTSPGQKSVAEEESEAVAVKRSELFTIFKNIVRIDGDLVIQLLLQELQHTLNNPQAPFQDVEILLTAVFELGEACTALMQQPGCGTLASLILPLIQLQVPHARHQVISIALLELFGRFYRVPMLTQCDLTTVLGAFVGPQGILHEAQSVSDRSCYLFMRFVKSCRGSIKPFAFEMLNSITEFCSLILRTPRNHNSADQTISDPRLHVFEAAGLLLGIEDLDPNQQSTGLMSMVFPAVQQIQTLLQTQDPMKEVLLVQSLEAVSRLSKGFRNEQVVIERPGLSEVFLKCLELALKLPSETRSKLVFSRVVSFLHRMVELLGKDTLKYLKAAFEVLMQREIEISQLIELVTLTHQLVTHFKGQLSPLLELVLPVLFQLIWVSLGEDWDWSGSFQVVSRDPGRSNLSQGVILDETREKTNLQRLYYGLIYAIFAQENGQVLLKTPVQCLESMLDTIQKGAGTHVDIPTRRLCVQVLVQLVENWQQQISQDPNLRQFVMCKLGHEICIIQILESNLDYRDAATNALFLDISTCLKSMFLTCGDEFLKLLSDRLLNSDFPPGLSLELMKQVQNSTAKELKDFFKKALTLLRTK